MNKFGIVLGAAAAVAIAGCKDPDYKYAGATASQNDVKPAESTVAIEPAAAPSCKCAPGTKHTSPCACGAADCACIVETKPIVIPVAPAKPVASKTAPEVTEYIVQSGDFLAKISKKYNVTINSIRRLNPQIKKDVIRVGQKIKLPGRVDVGVQKAPVVAKAPAKSAKAAKRSYAPYKGETKEYVVKNGDTLGAVAYSNGCNIRQLKELNGLSGDGLKIGQKLKVPVKKGAAAAKAPSAPAVEKPVAPAADVKPAVEPAKAAPEAAAEVAPAPAAVEPAADAKPAEAAPAPAPAAEAKTYVVQEADDLTNISIRWGVSPSVIRELNDLPEDAKLTPGQVLKLPADVQQ